MAYEHDEFPIGFDFAAKPTRQTPHRPRKGFFNLLSGQIDYSAQMEEFMEVR